MKKNKYKGNNKRNNCISNVVVGIVVGVISSFLATALYTGATAKKTERENHSQLVNNIEHIYTGANKEWMDEKFKKPLFSYSTDKYSGYVYKTDIAYINTLFLKNDSLVAYFVTNTSSKKEDKFSICAPYSDIVNHQKLGEFTYYNIADEPQRVAGYLSNGDSRIAYWEVNHYNGGMNYYTLCFATLDYGVPFDFPITDDDSGFDDEVNANSYDKNYYPYRSGNRKKLRPNTYGVISFGLGDNWVDDTEIVEIMTSYKYFDSFSVRKESPAWQEYQKENGGQ